MPKLLTHQAGWWSVLVSLAFLPASLWAQKFPHVVETEPLTPAEQQTKFRLPPGFKIELVASEPQIAKPMNMAFDARGRLFVTNSLEYPFPATGDGRDAVTMLEDRDGDGKYETATRAVDKLNIPIGVLPTQRELLVFSIPNTYLCRDADGDGTFEEKKAIFGPWGIDDTHGMNNAFTRWIDGWIYACHGFRNSSSVAGTDGKKMSLQSGNTYRFKADGSHIEQFSIGQVNPFGMCFDPLGNLYTADCHSQPMYQIIRGGTYPSFGKPHDGLGFAPTVITHSHGSTGIAGIVYYDANQFPEEYRGTVFIGNPITYRINHDRLEPHGASYKGIEQPDFLVCDDPWFRAVDLKLGPDGALYVADFYNCIIGHYEVPLNHPKRDRTRGRIWKIYYAGTDASPTKLEKIPDVTKLELNGLWTELASANISRRTMATNEMVDRLGPSAAPQVQTLFAKSDSAAQRAHALWVLERWGKLDDSLVKKAAADADHMVRVHLLKILTERSDWSSPDYFSLVREKLTDEDPYVRRAAAEALGLHPQAANVAPLITLWKKTPLDDTHLIHVARIALRNQLLDPQVTQLLRESLPKERDTLRALSDAARAARSADAAELLLTATKQLGSEADRVNESARHMARNLPDSRLEAVWEVLKANSHARQRADGIVGISLGLEERGATLTAPLRSAGVELAQQMFASNDRASKMIGLDLVKKLKITESFDASSSILLDSKCDEEMRCQAADACAATAAPRAIDALIRTLNSGAESNKLRSVAAQALATTAGDTGREALITSLKTVPWQVALDVAAAVSRQKPGAEALLVAVEKGQASAQLLQQRNVQQALTAAKLPDLDKKIASLTAGLVPLDQKVKALIDQRRGEFLAAKVDATAGHAAFKKNCGSCHRAANEGTKVGPDLDGIGNRGLDRLLEDMLDPNRNVDPAFRSTTIVTNNGLVITGLVLREEGDVVIIVDGKGVQQRVAKGDIEERRITPFSPMPANFSDQLPVNDFVNVVSFLLSQRQGK